MSKLTQDPIELIKSMLDQRNKADKLNLTGKTESVRHSIKKHLSVKEAQLNNKAFTNDKEQLAFIQYIAAKKIKDTFTGASFLNEEFIKSLCDSCTSVWEFYDRLSSHLTNPDYIDLNSFSKNMSKASEEIKTLNSDSPQVLLWQSLTSKFRNSDNTMSEM